MQKIEFVGRVDTINSTEPVDLSLIDEAELITDPVDIEDIIRRAVTITWKNSVFTYAELDALLARNYVVLPDLQHERYELYETIVQRLWHTQKELARTALNPLPTRLRYVDPTDEQTYHGLAVPLSLEFVEMPPAKETILVDVAERNEQQPTLNTIEIAKQIFTILIAAKGQETVVGVQTIKALIKGDYPAVDESKIDRAIRKMEENGYVTLRKTGQKKNTRHNLVMDHETRGEVLADMEEGAFEEGLNYMFAETTLR